MRRADAYARFQKLSEGAPRVGKFLPDLVLGQISDPLLISDPVRLAEQKPDVGIRWGRCKKRLSGRKKGNRKRAHTRQPGCLLHEDPAQQEPAQPEQQNVPALGITTHAVGRHNDLRNSAAQLKPRDWATAREFLGSLNGFYENLTSATQLQPLMGSRQPLPQLRAQPCRSQTRFGVFGTTRRLRMVQLRRLIFLAKAS